MFTAQLPTSATSFVGRADELATIKDLLADPRCRLLTIVGSGGIGKTRLALQAAAEQLSAFADGVCFVPLVGLGSPDLLATAIAKALPVTPYGADNLRTWVIQYLCDKQILLLLDNFEHLLDGVDLLIEVLQAAPGVKLLVTSRERLNVQEEWALTLEGLAFPSNDYEGSLERFSAVELFVERAQQAQPKFSLEDNAASVSTICQRVEGMPLGLELAASWLRAMTCRQIAAHMGRSLDFLTTPLRNVPERHRSLRALFEQSWWLLSADEQTVLMKLSVFRGGFDLEAAQVVAGATLLMLAGLVDKSLIRLNAAGRYDLHELLRQFAEDKLNELGDANLTCQRHLGYCVTLAEQAEAHQWGREQRPWFDRLEADLDNIRAALAWSMTPAEAETGLRLAGALGWYFQYRGHWSEGLTWLKQLLELTPSADARLRAKALNSAGELASMLNDEQWQALLVSALTLARQAHDDWNIAWALANLGWADDDATDRNAALAMEQESLALFRKLEDPQGLNHALRRCAIWAIYLGDYPYARTLLEEALIGSRAAGDANATAWALLFIGVLAWHQEHDLEQSAKLFRESRAQFAEVENAAEACFPLTLLARVRQIAGNDPEARALYEEALITAWEMHSYHNVFFRIVLLGLGSLAGGAGKPDRAAILLAAGESGIPGLFGFFPRSDFDCYAASVRAQLGDTAFAEAWAQGKAMTDDQVVAYMLEDRTTVKETQPSSHPAQPQLAEPLTAREFEVLRLLAEGLSNREIAKKLVISVATVKVHTGNIFGKLGVANRTQAVTQAQKLKLL